MGERIVTLYKEKVKRSWKIAFLAAFLTTVLVHIYKFTNTLPNHDSFYNVYSDQNMTQSGRWFLQIACGISSYFDLPWMNGLLCAVYLGLTAAVIAEIFDMKNSVVIALSGAVLAACPSTTETLFFEFTADGYFLGLLFSALSACLSIKGRKPIHYILSGICLCLSCAIYQAYISFAIVLCICYLVNRLLNSEMTVKETWKWIGRHIAIYVAGLVAYYATWKLISALTATEATTYQGIDTVGQVGISTLIGGAVKSVSNFVMFFVEWNILVHPITLNAILNMVFIVGLAIIILTSLVKSKAFREPGKLLMILFCLVAIIPMCSIWCFLSDGVFYRPMMLHSIALLYIFGIILFDKWTKSKISTAFGLFMAVIVFNFAVMANVSYFYLDKCYERTYYMGSQMMERVEQAQRESQQEINYIAFVGNRAQEVTISNTAPGDSIHILSSMIEEDFLYGSEISYSYLQNTFGLELQKAPSQRVNAIQELDEVKEMGSWPATDSVSVIDGILVIKLHE